ncbi:bifunctional 4-hydroxy-2-oxoglutarate aldolase/2-dehydro-3-deoxy-phosphogluconate aldolase [Leifsonia poae]|uniref:2-dehydro-3-deoxy-phosphogluconate aldolase n=1 Tax=Leifsonia poae TaxID=110933 RepID=A0A9W6LZR4_9MICO|nr:bifunctional 4-hydroxy-2-oxoglutarate aldolase/2-dehydro-3-deoxy-phosphogluconate aldolase [Leifsonia poae]GLJ75947.1 2-dehydro-3-deoxy-phosphogluconate aldolase [Leifsonia poae]
MIVDILSTDRTLAVVRAPRIDDPVALCGALVAGGIRTVEFTFTTPGVDEIIAASVAEAGTTGAVIGAGTVTDTDKAETAIRAGAQFLVTPGLHEGVAAVAREAGVPVLLGALSPTEVMRAVEWGAAAVKVFPASLVGPGYLKDLRGPFPEVPFVPSGGLHAGNAAEWSAAGALAVTAGSSVVSASSIESGDWETITARAREFSAAARRR